ncbi:hypothetical protein QE417_002813 [Mucilaginibacter terrae]|uniref:Prepilin type IV endopeptidase peptidase domain-containing protein n=1 Tax=Mucilaginibacter terrae TaxID=1955052 RepID=A0ABU3GVE0_9SPHI|nr:hypothetical protein [Mucilaginibacter terrae]
MLVVQILIIVFLAALFFEDMRYRAVHWFWFPLLIIASFFLHYFGNLPVSIFINRISTNGGFIWAILILLTSYFSIKHRKFVNINDGLLGAGDILFWVVAGCYLSLLNFMLFYISSVILILLGWLIYQQFSESNNKRIPLAGLQSFLLASTISLSWFRLIPSVQTDDYLINMLLLWN